MLEIFNSTRLHEQSHIDADIYISARKAYKELLGEPSSHKGPFINYSHDLVFDFDGRHYKIQTVAVSRRLSERMTTQQVIEELRNPDTDLYCVVTSKNWLIITDRRPIFAEQIQELF